ncbi:pyridoxal phosphate-dependent aminotransferase [Phenylobacterium sp.]|uniref:pyridoxal phosphate-dependent aminotransferase n=1 Tax=Phenylobacterium sp. TaxID=1871053 RepID=UPI0025FA54A3|nr:pyridoxal phosphate-dependent aminotransferase [Phenylobacterium sp.]
MTEASAGLSEDFEADLTRRGYSRRSFGRIFGLLAAGPGVASVAGAAFAQTTATNPHAKADAGAAPTAVSAMVHIGANECWTGPLEPGAKAAAAAVATGNRYTSTQRTDFVNAVVAVEKVPASHVLPWAGSSDPMARIVVTYCSPTRGLVIANPTFELAPSVARYIGAKVSEVPLTADYRHDVKAMLAADPNAGVYYICTPNNPTATITPLADVEWLLANKPAGSIVLLDEAYTHFAGVPVGSYLAAQDKDIIVLRTFSKLFGMAGMRMGLTIARPELMMKTMRYDGQMASFALPNPSVVCGAVSLVQADLIAKRRAEMVRVRDRSLALLDKRKIGYIPPAANFFMVDWKKPARDVKAAFAGEGIEIGRSWPIWPNLSRITVGSASEMDAFNAAVVKLNL